MKKTQIKPSKWVALAIEKIQERVDKMKPGDKIYYPPQIQIGGHLVRTARLLRQAGLIPAEKLNYWITG